MKSPCDTLKMSHQLGRTESLWHPHGLTSPRASPFSRSVLDSLSPLDSPVFRYTQALGQGLLDLPTLLLAAPVRPVKALKQVEFPQHSVKTVFFSSFPVTLTMMAPERPRGAKRRSRDSASKASCNCEKSRCLKLYCDCFASGGFCDGCNCVGCFNNSDHEDSRREAISATLERNPHAFKPKIKTANSGVRHNRGCNCSKSACSKKYCECYSSQVLCSEICKCVGCRNSAESAPIKRTRMKNA